MSNRRALIKPIKTNTKGKNSYGTGAGFFNFPVSKKNIASLFCRLGWSTQKSPYGFGGIPDLDGH
jgi:hypothetical protein